MIWLVADLFHTSQSKYARGTKSGNRNDEEAHSTLLWNPIYTCTFSVECTQILLLLLFTQIISVECTWNFAMVLYTLVMDMSCQLNFRKRCTRSQNVGLTCRPLLAIVVLCVNFNVKMISILASGFSSTLFHHFRN